jgi:hypothetical protein
MLASRKAVAKGMSHSREIYRSSNGDRWLLVREPDTGRVLVRHEPNAGPGGRPDEDEVGAFLSRDPHTPERQALLRLIGTLAEDR